MTSYIYRWDLDKTYIKTEFDTIRDIIRIAFQRAHEKQNVPGAASLLKELQRRPGNTEGAQRNLIFFISGSPRQMRKVLEEKLSLDGIKWDEFVLKPNLKNLLLGHFRALREQVGYKLPILLASRSAVPPVVPEVLFGDDAESDAFVYSLYADLVAGRVGKEELDKVLALAQVYPDARKKAFAAMSGLTKAEAVRRIFIHLDRKSPPGRFSLYGRRVVPIYNYFEAALVLYSDGILTADSVLRVGLDMMGEDRYSVDMLTNSFQDLLRRGILERHTAAHLAHEISKKKRDDIPPNIFNEFLEKVRSLKRGPEKGEGNGGPPLCPSIDYPGLFLHAQKLHTPSRRRSLWPSFLEWG